MSLSDLACDGPHRLTGSHRSRQKPKGKLETTRPPRETALQLPLALRFGFYINNLQLLQALQGASF